MTPRRNVPLVSIVALVIALSACSRAMSTPSSSPERLAPRAADVAEASPSRPDFALESQRLAPYLVRHGWLDLVSAEPPVTAARAQEIARGFSGVVQNASVTRQRAELHLRVPEVRLDEALDSLSTLGTVASRRLSADDVTNEVIDLEARIASLVGVRDRLRALLERASSMSEVMSTERELARVQAEIDGIEGRLRHLRSQAAMAELSLSVRKERILGPLGIVVAAVAGTIGKLFVIQ